MPSISYGCGSPHTDPFKKVYLHAQMFMLTRLLQRTISATWTKVTYMVKKLLIGGEENITLLIEFLVSGTLGIYIIFQSKFVYICFFKQTNVWGSFWDAAVAVWLVKCTKHWVWKKYIHANAAPVVSIPMLLYVPK